MTEAGAVLDFWFAGEPNRYRPCWFHSDPAIDPALFDAAIRARFSATWEAARRGLLEAWEETPAGALALVLVLDQFPRSMHRGTALAFATDERARAAARRALARGFGAALTPVQQLFLHLPFEHSEDLADQDEAVRLCEALGPITSLSSPDAALDFARRHREVIRRFGRFPHRNAALGRVSTPEELEYLNQPGSGF